MNSRLVIVGGGGQIGRATARQIGEAIMSIVGVEAEIVTAPADAHSTSVGRNPWGVPLDMTCAPSAAYAPIGGYADLVRPTVNWLMDDVDPDDWRSRLPVLASYPYEPFDYEAEDVVMSR
jgi:hypothetical protein